MWKKRTASDSECLYCQEHFSECTGCPSKGYEKWLQQSRNEILSCCPPLHKKKWGTQRRRRRRRSMWLTESSKIKICDVRVACSGLMFIPSFVQIGLEIETRAAACSKPAWWTHKHTLPLCSKSELHYVSAFLSETYHNELSWAVWSSRQRYSSVHMAYRDSSATTSNSAKCDTLQQKFPAGDQPVWGAINDGSLQLLVLVLHVFSTTAFHSEKPPVCCQLMWRSLT